MKLAIMQPYFLPYIGYFQLIAASDVFVVYDNIQYTKKGWINRNRMLANGNEKIFSLPLKKDSDRINIIERFLADEFDPVKFLNQFSGSYAKAPYFQQTIYLLEKIAFYPENNLFRFIKNSIEIICQHLKIETKIITSSTIDINHSLKSQHKVLALCHALGAKIYINSIGGTELYKKEDFEKEGIKLYFLQPLPFDYQQFDNNFVPWLSIIDVLMFNSIEETRLKIFNNFTLV
jgi:hypothetical protein